MGEQDERIARLTELARKAWPDLDLQPDVDVEMEDRNAFVWQIGFTDHTLVRIVQHDRAHEALEAALRSLAGEPSAAEQELQRLRDGVRALADALEAGTTAWLGDDEVAELLRKLL